MSPAHRAARLASVALLLVVPLASATQEPSDVDRERQRRLEDELKDAEQRVWIADQDWLVILTGPGVNRINRINRTPLSEEAPHDPRQQLEAAALRRLGAAKTVVAEIEARLAGLVADLSPAHSLRQEYDTLPGKVTLRWSSVPGATAYTIEVNKRRRGDGLWGMWEYVTKLERPEHTLEVGSAPMRWRVWAVDRAGRGGPICEWSTFPGDD